jgi:O-antigen biosynthesis protein WbqP
MSLAGPRPLLVNQKSLIVAREQFGVHRIKPGITGLAQVSGRDELSDEAKVRLDAQYLNQMSLTLDAQILARTVLNVMRSNGVRH